MSNYKRNLFLLSFIIIVSVVVRVPYLGDKMGRHHEWLTAHVLLVNNNYEQAGISDFYFAPVMNTRNLIDLKIGGFLGILDKDNNNYYTSYPPMAFVLPYFVFKPFGGASVLGIRILGLINHVLCGLLIFVIINRFFKHKIKNDKCLPGILGFSAYMFATGNLWFHAHVYFSDMQVHLFILSFLYFLIRYFDGDLGYKKSMFLLFLFSFLGAYTEWLAVFVSFFACVLLFLKSIVYKGKSILNTTHEKQDITENAPLIRVEGKDLLLAVALGVGTLFAIALTLYQYSLIAGWEVLYDAMMNKYIVRSGMSEAKAEHGRSYSNSFSWLMLSKHYESNYGPVMDYVWFAFLSIIPLFLGGYVFRNRRSYSSMGLILFLLMLAIFTHHGVFFNFTTVHDFSTLKSSMFFSLFIGATSGLVINYFKHKSWPIVNKVYTVVAVVCMIVVMYRSTNGYYNVNDRRFLNTEAWSYGEVIRNHTTPDELITAPYYWHPLLVYYSRRNVQVFWDANAAIEFMKKTEGINKLAFISKKEGVFTVQKYNKKGELTDEVIVTDITP